MTHHRYCENCREHLVLDCSFDEINKQAKELGWQVCSNALEALCASCKETCRIETYANGEYNNSLLINATAEGIELDGIATLDWEWIDAVRAKVKEEELVR